MGSEWKEVTLGEVANIDTGFPFKSKDYRSYGNMKVIRGKNISEGFIRWGNDAMYWDFDLNKLIQYHNHMGDIVIGMDGSKIGKNRAQLLSSDIPSLLAQRVCRVRALNEFSIQKFLWQIINSTPFENYIRLIQTGTSIPHISLKQISKFTFKLPPLTEQKAIAHILGTLDEKIELNRRMNATLEQMAQALFKSWFVDFDPVIDKALAAGNPIPEPLQKRAEKRKALGDKRKPLPENIQKLFPDAFEFCEELDKWVPKGWEGKTLDELVFLIGGGTPKTSINEYWNGNIPWFSVVDAPNDSDVFVIDTEKKITQLGVENSSTKILRKGTTIISARGTVGKCALVGTPMAMNQSCYGVQGKHGGSDFFVYYAIRENISNLQQRGHGSVFNTITRDTFKSIKLAYGNDSICNAFDGQAMTFFEKIKNNLFQNQGLTNIRNTLLPKLISGEIRIPEAKTILQEEANLDIAAEETTAYKH